MRIPGLQWEARCPQSFTQTRISGTHRLARSRFRYVWPSELDLMARLAGMSLRERWSGWASRSPATAPPRVSLGEDRAGSAQYLSADRASQVAAQATRDRLRSVKLLRV
jgi:hypothetical protein